MAFTPASLIPQNNSSKGLGVTLYTYKTTDAKTTIDTSGYFNNASYILQVGDIIDTVVFTTGTPVGCYRFYVLSNAAGVVDVSDATAATSSFGDTD